MFFDFPPKLSRSEKLKGFIQRLFILKHARRSELGPSRTASYSDLWDAVTDDVPDYRMIFIRGSPLDMVSNEN